MIKIEMSYLIFLLLLLLPYLSLTEKCHDERDEYYSDEYKRCCDKTIQCQKGEKLGCTSCEICENGTFMSVGHTSSDKKVRCTLYSQCNPDQKEVFPGNTTHNRLCECKDGFVKNTDFPNGCEKVQITEPPETTTQIINLTSSSPITLSTGISLEESHILPVVVGGITTGVLLLCIIIIAAGCFLKHHKKCRLCIQKEVDKEEKYTGCDYNKTTNGQSAVNLFDGHFNDLREYSCPTHTSVGDVKKNKSDFEVAKENIRNNMKVLRDEMESSPGLFWAALKEGNGFSYEEQQRCELISSYLEKNGRILDVACKNENLMEHLIYALLVKDQENLAKIISEPLTEKLKPSVNHDFVKRTSKKERLTYNRLYIANNLSVGGQLWQFLRTKNIFTEEEETIANKMVETAQVDYLIELMLKNELKYNHFLEALREIENHMFDLLSDEESQEAGESELLLPQQPYYSMPSPESKYDYGKQAEDDMGFEKKSSLFSVA